MRLSAALALLFASLCAVRGEGVSVRLEGTLFKAVNIPSGLDPASLPDLFLIYVDSDSTVPPMAGSYRLDNGELIFQPRFPLQPGVRYRAVFQAPGGPPVTVLFDVPKERVASATEVVAVYPTVRVVPENLLKFYIHFSAPMARGEAYRRIHLLDAAGREIADPFLELAEELWDPEGRRLTVFFDPGRVKRGLVPFNEVGPPLEEGRSFTLTVDREWTDALSLPLVRGFRKEFSVGPADRTSVDPARWATSPPRAGTSDELVVKFAEPLDRALLERTIHVRQGQGQPLEGTVQIESMETLWRFRPAAAWKAGRYQLQINVLLADLAGNRVDRVFDVDVFERVDARITEDFRFVDFTVE